MLRNTARQRVYDPEIVAYERVSTGSGQDLPKGREKNTLSCKELHFV